MYVSNPNKEWESSIGSYSIYFLIFIFKIRQTSASHDYPQNNLYSSSRNNPLFTANMLSILMKLIDKFFKKKKDKINP